MKEGDGRGRGGGGRVEEGDGGGRMKEGSGREGIISSLVPRSYPLTRKGSGDY